MRVGGDSSYSHEGAGAPTEYPVRLADLGLPPGGRARRIGCASGDGAFDVVVEALDDVAGAGFFEVLRLDAEDGCFELFLPHVSIRGEAVQRRFSAPGCDLWRVSSGETLVGRVASVRSRACRGRYRVARCSRRLGAHSPPFCSLSVGSNSLSRVSGEISSSFPISGEGCHRHLLAFPRVATSIEVPREHAWPVRRVWASSATEALFYQNSPAKLALTHPFASLHPKRRPL